MKNKIKQLSAKDMMNKAKFIILAVILGLGLNYASAVFNNPTAKPPAENKINPLNVLPTDQTKGGNRTPLAGSLLNIDGTLAAQNIAIWKIAQIGSSAVPNNSGDMYINTLAGPNRVCVNADGSTDPHKLIVCGATAGQAPVVTFSTAPGTVNDGHSAVLVWTVANNATTCTASGGNGEWTGSKSVTGGNQSTSTMGATWPPISTYTITCSNAFGSDTKSVNIFREVNIIKGDIEYACETTRYGGAGSLGGGISRWTFSFDEPTIAPMVLDFAWCETNPYVGNDGFSFNKCLEHRDVLRIPNPHYPVVTNINSNHINNYRISIPAGSVSHVVRRGTCTGVSDGRASDAADVFFRIRQYAVGPWELDLDGITRQIRLGTSKSFSVVEID